MFRGDVELFAFAGVNVPHVNFPRADHCRNLAIRRQRPNAAQHRGRPCESRRNPFQFGEFQLSAQLAAGQLSNLDFVVILFAVILRALQTASREQIQLVRKRAQFLSRQQISHAAVGVVCHYDQKPAMSVSF
jgi:hypothetical protein